MKTITTLLVLLAVAGLVAAGWIYSGWYDIGADSPHSKPVFALLTTLQQRSVRHHASGIAIPANLDDAQVILKGAGQYAAMCTGCHLAPGMANSEIRPGLYPQPPDLSRIHPVEPRATFWIIKHGIKMSAMPAWGSSHDDATIWSMVAFLQKLPGMTQAQYRDIVVRAPPDDDMDMDEGKHGKGGTPAQGIAIPAGAASAAGLATGRSSGT
jgi:mono/diheme cytochrome c family protein